MDKDQVTPSRGRSAKIAAGVGLLAAGALAGGVLSGTLSASADTTPTPGASSSAGTESTAPQQSDQQGQKGPGGSAPVRSDEKTLSSADAETVKAAALKAVPGGTVYRIETDAGDGAYEAHMTDSSGKRVTVKFDKNFAVIGVEDGMGKGDPAPSGQGQQGQRSQQGAAPSASSSTGT